MVELSTTLTIAVLLMQYSPDREPGNHDAVPLHPAPGLRVVNDLDVLDAVLVVTPAPVPVPVPVPVIVPLPTVAVALTLPVEETEYEDPTRSCVWPSLAPMTVLQT